MRGYRSQVKLCGKPVVQCGELIGFLVGGEARRVLGCKYECSDVYELAAVNFVP